MNLFRKLFGGALGRFLGRLRFPGLFVFTVLVFLADLAIPDGLPLADEILLAVGSLILANLKERVTETGERAEDGAAGDAEVPSAERPHEERVGDGKGIEERKVDDRNEEAP